MKLEVGTFPVHDIVFGTQTRWQDGALSVNKDELLALIMEDPYIAWADIGVTRPGDSVRIVQIRDIVEPKVKVSDPGVTYPGHLRARRGHRGARPHPSSGRYDPHRVLRNARFQPRRGALVGDHIRRGPQRHYLYRYVGTGRRNPFCPHHQPLSSNGTASGILCRRLEPGEQCRHAEA